jgi:tRNA threonylcarbamoyladenosine biosynthesis protein TsaE
MPVDINLPDAGATEALGAALAPGLIPGRVLHLRGDLGTGKTTLVRGLLRALGYAGRVRSPTYTLVEPYTVSSLHFYHFDLYRLKNEQEWRDSGFQEYFNPHSACAVEWPERAALPPPDLTLTLQFAGAGRRATLSGDGWLSSVRLS